MNLKENNLTIEELEQLYGNSDKLRQNHDRKRFESEPFQPTTPEQSDYMKRVNNPGQEKELSFDAIIARMDRQIARHERRRDKCPVDYDQAKYVFWTIYKSTIEAKGGELMQDGNLLQVLPDLIKWSIGDDAIAFPLSKGLYLYGPVGVGKTHLLRTMEEFSKAISYEVFKTVNIPDVSNKLRLTKDYAVLNPYQSGRWCFDDLAADKTTNTYGNQDDVSIMLISAWYEHQHRDGISLLATGNEAPEAIRERYQDDRFFDRFKELLHPVLLTGKSKKNMTYAGILDAFESTLTALRTMHPSDISVWCREMNNKPLADLQEVYGVEESILMALFCYDTNCQRFHSLPLTSRDSDLVSIKNLFRIFVIRLKDKRVAGIDYSTLTTSL